MLTDNFPTRHILMHSHSEEIRVRMQVYLSMQDELLKVLSHQEKFSAPGGQADAICDKMVNAEVNKGEASMCWSH